MTKTTYVCQVCNAHRESAAKKAPWCYCYAGGMRMTPLAIVRQVNEMIAKAFPNYTKATKAKG